MKLFRKKYQSLEDNNKPKQNEFNIYTTGIANWGLLEKDQNLVVSWKLDCRNNIIKNIPKKYTINIYHYDPILQVSSNYEEASNEVKKKVKNYINKYLIPFDLKHKRVKYSKFFSERFTPDIIEEPYIIFDMAHLFKFKNGEMNKVIRTSEYNQNNQEILNLNVLRIGFIPNMEISRLLLENKLFSVESNENIITYIDMMSWLNKEFNESEPALSINNLFKKTVKQVEEKICELRSEDSNKLPLFKIESIIEKINEKKFIIAEIIRNLWDSNLTDETPKSIANMIIEKHIVNILQIELIK